MIKIIQQFKGQVEDIFIVASPKELSSKIKHLKADPEWRSMLLAKQTEQLAGFDPMVTWEIDKWIK